MKTTLPTNMPMLILGIYISPAPNFFADLLTWLDEKPAKLNCEIENQFDSFDYYHPGSTISQPCLFPTQEPSIKYQVPSNKQKLITEIINIRENVPIKSGRALPQMSF